MTISHLSKKMIQGNYLTFCQISFLEGIALWLLILTWEHAAVILFHPKSFKLSFLNLINKYIILFCLSFWF